MVREEPESVEEDSEFLENEIVRQSVEAGTSLTKGESITLTYAVVGFNYPDFTDGTYSISDVEAFCEENNIKLEVVETVSESNLEGTIYNQSRKAGTPVQSGASFKIWVYVNSSDEEENNSDIGGCQDGLC